VLARGYSLTSHLSEELLTDCDSVDVGDTIKTRLAKGTIVSKVESKES
jgi:exonuclease VII large subunit